MLRTVMKPFIAPVFRCWSKQNFNVLLKVIRCTSSESTETIVVPRRINRGPTDILKALSSTVNRDDTAPHYKYHDDPYLTPVSNVGKRTFAMAKESGRKAARWIQDQHANFFMHKEADPFIEEFAPCAMYNENSDVDETTLQTVIKNAQVSDAITVYNILEKKGTGISNDLKQSFLELLCFFNCDDPLPEELLEERWFHQSGKGREKQRKTWKDNSLAETVFLSFQQKDSAAYRAIIQGMTRFCQVERAWQLFEEAREKNIVLCTETYNALIRVVNFLRESSDLRWKLIEELLSEMTKQKLQPNIGTLNSILEGISTMGNYRQNKDLALRTLSEFKKLNIPPSLASYYYLLVTFYKPRGPASNVLLEILDHIQGHEFSIQDPKDTYFFVTAMDICSNQLQDKELAYRVHELLRTGNNYILIGDSYKESIYYRHFFVLLCATESFEVFIEFYHKFVPHIYTPEPAVMEEVIKVLDMNGAIEYIPQIWSDIVMFEQTTRENVVSALLATMVQNRPDEGSEFIEKFGHISWDIWTRQNDVEDERYRQWRWTGHMLGNVMTLLLRANRFKDACKILEKLNGAQQEILGVPHVDTLKEFLDGCIEEKDVKTSVMCIQYCSDAMLPDVEKMAERLVSELPLDERTTAQLSNIVGKDLSKIQNT